MLSGIFMKYS